MFASHREHDVVEIRTVFRDTVIGTRHLDPRRPSVSPLASAALPAGAGTAVLAIALFLWTAHDRGVESDAYRQWQVNGGSAATFPWKPRSEMLAVVIFGGLGLAGALAAFGLGLRRPADANDGCFRVGRARGVAAPAGAAYVTSPSHPLVIAASDGVLINPTAQMKAELIVAGGRPSRVPFLDGGGAFSLPRHATARIACGETTFVVTATPAPAGLGRRRWAWRWNERVYDVASAAASGLLVVIVFALPADPKALSFDDETTQLRRLAFLIKPPASPTTTGYAAPGRPPGHATKPTDSDLGQSGRNGFEAGDGLAGMAHRDSRASRLARAAPTSTTSDGLLGVLARANSPRLQSIFGATAALGEQADDVLAALVGAPRAGAYGLGGLTLTGTGASSGGTGESTVGEPHLATVGRFGDKDGRRRNGPLGDRLPSRTAQPPEARPGPLSVRGGLDREVVRRIVRRHVNEVRFCYERQLVRSPRLAGRVVIQFTIAPNGQVLTSTLQDSTLANAAVETCVVAAARRWPFPAPAGGGLVIVSYPFLFTPATLAAEE